MLRELVPRERIPEMYAAVGAAWILVTSLAIPWLSGERLEGAWLEVAKGLGFVGVSALVMRSLVPRENSESSKALASGSLAWQLGAVLALGGVAGGLGAWVGADRARELLSRERASLQLVAELQAKQLGVWQERRIADAERARQNRSLLSAYMEGGTTQVAETRIAELARVDGVQFALYDTRCELVAGDTGGHESHGGHGCTALAGEERVWRVGVDDDGHLRLRVAVPMRQPNGEALGTAVVHEDLESALLPELRRLLEPHPSIGALLLEHQGDGVHKLATLHSAARAADAPEPDAASLAGVDQARSDLRAADGRPLIAAYAPVASGPLAVLVTSPRSAAVGTVPLPLRYGFLSAGLTLLMASLALYGWRSRGEALLQAAGKAEAERELAEHAKKEWEHLVLELPELGVCLADAATGKLVYANERLAQMLGRDRDSLVGSTWQPIARPEQLAKIGAAVAQLVEGEAEHATLDISGPDAEGVERHTVTDLRAVRDSHGALTHFAAIVRDVTDEKERREERERLLREQHAGLIASIDAIARMIELRDPYTAGHQRRVSELAAAIGDELGLEERRVEGLRVAGKIHDLGKVSCPAEILVKPGPLTTPERDIARQHTVEGAKILEGLELPWPLSEIVHQHHEHIDGTGYPRQLRGDDILLEARVIRVASTYVALTSHRPYRPARTQAEAVDELERHAGTRYDADVVSACVRLIREGKIANGAKSS